MEEVISHIKYTKKVMIIQRLKKWPPFGQCQSHSDPRLTSHSIIQMPTTFYSNGLHLGNYPQSFSYFPSLLQSLNYLICWCPG